MKSDSLRQRMIQSLDAAARCSIDHSTERGGSVVIKTSQYYAELDRARMWRDAATIVEETFNDPAILSYLAGRRSLG